MISPLWSLKGECHRFECALTSPAMREFGVFKRVVKSVVMLLSSSFWLVFVFLGGMYRFVMVRSLPLVKGTLIVCDSMGLVVVWVDFGGILKGMEFLM